MRSKKLTALFAALVLAGTLGTGTIIASAGTVESKPAGDGLITSSNELNITNFRVLETEAGDADAYTVGEAEDYSVLYNSGEWQEMLIGSPVPKETMAKEDAKVTLTYRITGLTSDNAQLKIIPGASSLSEANTYGYVLTGSNNGIEVVDVERTSAQETDPVSKLIAHHAGDAEYDIPQAWQAYSWSCGTFKNNIAAYGMADFRIEMVVNENNWIDVTLSAGYFDQWQRWAPGATITNWAPYDGTNDFYANVWTRYADGMLVDGAELSVSYTEGGETKTDTIFTTDMDDASKVITAADGTAAEGCYIARGMEYTPVEASGLKATNPALGTGIITRAALQTDKDLATNLELNAQVILQSVAEGQKVGFGFGFEGNRSLEGAHKYLYFTVQGSAVMFGAESVDDEGTATALMEEQVVMGAAVGEDAAAIPVTMTGKGANFEIVIGTNAAITLNDFDPDGFFAVFHKGEGDLTYMLAENLTMTGYQFKENEEGAETVTSNFTGNYLSSEKFQVASTIAPEMHMVATDTTSHALTGLTVENGKVGFYGTATGTRILTNKKYADFVLQFDYISVPVQQRGALVLSGDRPSAAYIVFGMKEGGLAITDSTVYTIGINEGLATDFYGDNETVISGLAMATTCGCPTVGISKNKQTDTPTELSIPHYGANGGYDASKPDNNVESWYDADTENPANIYSMYNKTTRVKLVCIDNHVALFLAEVNTETGEIIGEYVKVISFDAVDSEGYVGIATDSPAYFEMDNLAITPISREDVLAFVSSGEEVTANIVADVKPADMDEDPMPTPLESPVLTVDSEGKKITWAAVDGAADYEVSIRLGNETVLEQTVTETQFDLSTLIAEGTYRITVTANPEDTSAHLSSRASAEYTVAGTGTGDDSGSSSGGGSSAGGGSSEGGSSESGSGCGSAFGLAIFPAAAAAFVLALKKRKN